MSLVTIARYRTITGDSTSATGLVQGALNDAEQDLEEALDRPLAEAERTESLPLVDSRRHGLVVYPPATPVTDAGALTIRGNAILGATPSTPLGVFEEPSYATVTYTGGWTAATLPRCIERDICWAVKAALAQEAPVAAGAVSVSLGDASVSFGSQSGRRAAEDDRWSRQTMRYRRRHQ